MNTNPVNSSNDLLFKEECYQIVGLAMKVHSSLRKGFKEIVYKDALEIELQRTNIPYKREQSFNIKYDGIVLPHKFNADFLVFEQIILEVKAVTETPYEAFKQTLNYLKASQVTLGIILNFGTDKLTFNRVVCTY